MGGKVAGVDCPNCELKTKEMDFNAYVITEITRPECSTTILSEDEKSKLR